MSGSERSRSRSQSPTLTNQSKNSKASRHHQSRSPSEKSYSDESFYSEAPRKNAKSQRNKPPSKGPTKNRGKNNSKDSSRRSSVIGGAAPRGNHGAVSRIMSANRLRITELHNRVSEMTEQLVVLQQENRDLKRLIWKQERKLNGYEQQENGMPQIMHRQAGETQMLRDQLRQQKERCDKKSKKLKEKEDELEAMRRLVKKMQGLVEDKKLVEKKKLSEKLKETEDKLQKEKERNEVLERNVQLLSKNHKHQLASERAKEQELERQIEKLQEKYDKLEMDMKEKEKERTLNNIYSNRLMKPPHRLDSSVQSSSQTELTRTSKSRPDGKEKVKTDEKQRRAGGSGDPSGRMEDYSPKKFERKHEDPLIQFNRGEESGYQESQSSVYRVEDKREKEKDIKRDKEKDTPRGKEKDIARDRERESDIKNDDPLSWLHEERAREQEQERRSWLEAKEKEDAKRRKEERKREEEERKREEEEKREKEEEEKRKEQQPKRGTEHHQQPTLQNLEQNHFDNRNNNKNGHDIPRKLKKDEEKDEDRSEKDELLAKLRAIDEGKQDKLSASTRKEYNFTQPINNLHQGLPAHGQRKANNFEDDSPAFGSYRPSFALDDSKTTKQRDSRTSNKPELENKNKNSDAFAELFATEPKRASNVLTDARQDSPVLLDLGSSTTKAKSHPTQLHREKQAIVPVFRPTANKIVVSDEEVEEIEELAI